MKNMAFRFLYLYNTPHNTPLPEKTDQYIGYAIDNRDYV